MASFGDELVKDVRRCVECGLSWGVYGDGGRLVGFRLSFIISRDEEPDNGTPISKVRM